ncbi:hypothetical protein MACK_002950 [Theileria orientalis]|uniref:Uncharacterized protein n=1 Tax=Theileria orientalis TaxID=68886 RepID=A0A976MFA4_THEOR|nr:hypothetical protein MACK_002950 [Theileria orientalis]
MKDIKNNSSAVYYYVSLLKMLDKDVKNLFGYVEKLRTLKGITTEPKIMDSILGELKDKVKDLLDFIDFGIQLRDKKLYDIKIFLKTKPFDQLKRFKNINKTWEGIKAHDEWAKNHFMFKFKTPINYDHSENGKPKPTMAPAKVQNITTQTPKTTVLKAGLKPAELSSFDLQTTPKPTTEANSKDNGSATGEQISGQNGGEDDYHYYSGSGVDYIYSGSGLEPTEQASGLEPGITTISPKTEETQTTGATTTAKSATETEVPSTVTEATTTEPEFFPVKTVKPSIPTQKTTTSHQKATTVLHPESGTTEMKIGENSRNSQDPKLSKNQQQPIIVRPTFETDKLDSKMDQIIKDLGTLADKVIYVFNTIKKADATKQDQKTQCLGLIYEAESMVIDMDCKMNEIYRSLTDALRYDHNVKFNNLKHIHTVHEKDTIKLLQSGEEMKNVFERNKKDIISPILMFFVASLIKDFLVPSILPYAFMQIYVNDMVLLAVVIELYSSILVLIIERLATEFRNWNQAYDTFWVMAAPLIAILLTSTLALNTNLPRIRAFYRSETKVLLVTISLLVFGSILKQISYVSVANYVYYQSGDVLGNVKYLLSYHLGAIVFRFIVCTLAIKTESKLNLGFRFPNLPIQQNPGNSCFLLWLKSGIKSSLKEAFGDFATNIWRYT